MNICFVIVFILIFFFFFTFLGVFFNYDISPMQVTYTEYQKPFSHFLTDVCAVVGGVFTVAGIIDSIIYTAEKSFQRKVELGKAS